jgi:exosortase
MVSMHSTSLNSGVLSHGSSANNTRLRLLCLTAIVAISSAFSVDTLLSVIRLASSSGEYSCLFGVLPISVGLIYLERRRIFAQLRWSSFTGLSIALIAALTAIGVHSFAPDLEVGERLAVSVLLLISVWIAGFCACLGASTARRALFPLLFLYFLVPIPDVFMSPIMTALRHGSADVTSMLLYISRVPYFRDHESFLLVNLRIEIAPQCSGIRSSIALLMTGLVVSHLCLRSVWSKSIFLLAIPPLAIFKNGLRIFTLSVLSAYVSPRFLEGSLHRDGGILFFAITLAAAGLLLILLQKIEKARSRPAERAP